MALLTDSSAIDAADDTLAPTTDARGITRPQGIHSDIGAYEYVQSLAPAPSSIVLAIGGTNPVGGVTNVQIPNPDNTDTTGLIADWVAGTANAIKFTVTDTAPAVSSVTINTVPYTSGTDYAITTATPLTVVVTTTQTHHLTAVRTFTIGVNTKPTVASQNSGSTSGGGTTYGCKDPIALNYNAFSISEPSLCQYAKIIITSTPTNAVVSSSFNSITPTTTPKQILGSGKCSTAFTITENLKLGDRDHKYSKYNKGKVTQVAILQAHINRILAVYYKKAAGPVDGFFGSSTKKGVERLQKVLNTVLQPKHLLKIDGIVGPYTKAAINDSCGGM